MQVFDLRLKTCSIADEYLVTFYRVFHLSIKIHPPDPNGCHLSAFD